VDKAILKF